jgi:uncharacterized DUF497 family protein
MYFTWDTGKNEKLKAQRNITFEDIVIGIINNNVLDILEHPDPIKYPEQKLYIIKHNDYVYVVPAIISEKEIRLITIFQSRKFNKMYNKEKEKL